jgi:hypothetical protein
MEVHAKVGRGQGGQGAQVKVDQRRRSPVHQLSIRHGQGIHALQLKIGQDQRNQALQLKTDQDQRSQMRQCRGSQDPNVKTKKKLLKPR